MAILIAGLVIFLGMHSIRIFADGWRTRMIARMGEKPWKAIYAIISLLGFVLVIWGFGQARMNPALLYAPPAMLRHLNSLFTLIAFIFLAAAYVPRNHLKAKFGHPMVLGVKIWAFGHLLAIGFLRDVVLFGAFLAWAILIYAALAAAIARPASPIRPEPGKGTPSPWSPAQSCGPHSRSGCTVACSA